VLENTHSDKPVTVRSSVRLFCIIHRSYPSNRYFNICSTFF